MDYLNFKPRAKTGFYAQSFLEQIILCLGEINGYFIFITRSWVGAYADYCEFNEGEANQLLGTSTTALLLGIIFTVIVQPTYDWLSFAAAFLSGCFWSVGQYLQFNSFQLLPVSEAMPISNGTQLIGTTFIAAIFFKEWTNLTMIMIGMTGILLIILGIRLTSYIEEQGKKQSNTIKRKAITLLLLSSAALTIYVTLPQALLVSGAVVLFPQSIGMWFSSLCLTIIKREEFAWSEVVKNLGTGVAWSIANLSLFFAMPIIGVAKSFTFSQMAVLISIYAGIFILKVRKTKKELCMISAGAAVITLGIFLIGSIK